MDALIGYTGFVGGNLLKQKKFGALFNSVNIHEIEEREFDLVVCAGVRAEKWKANQNPEADLKAIDNLAQSLEKIQAREFVLISTIDVYPVICDVNEAFDCRARPNHPYGKNRLWFEERVQELFGNVRIFRLSGLFGDGLKKNVIFDLMHDNCLEMINRESRFQWYNLAGLWSDIEQVREQGLPLVNLVNEPVTTSDIIERFFPDKKVGGKEGAAAHYDIRTKYVAGGYWKNKEEVLREIGEFIGGCTES